MAKINNDITYLGRTFRTSLSKPLTDEEYNEIVETIRRKPDFSEVEAELEKIHNGSTRMGKVLMYYLQDVLYKARNGQDAWSIDEALSYKPIMEYFNAKISINDKVYPPTLSKGENIKTAFRLCGIRCCRKLPNFPMKTIDMLLDEYLPNGGNYYDYSCGWAARMLSAMKKGVSYYGTDPNTELMMGLAKIAEDYDNINGVESDVNLFGVGSEVFVPSMENKIDFAFSSPPYFTLELYNVGKQSCSEETSYEDWLNNYIKPTIDNIYKYLKNDGIFAINIKDVVVGKVNYSLVDDINSIISDSGKFEFIGTHDLKNNKRTFGTRYWAKHEVGVSDKCDELIFVYKKVN